MTDGVPLKLKLDPDEYRCTWFLPNEDGTTTPVPGDLVLRANDAPRGHLYGDDVPVEWTISDGSKGAGFPQTKTYEQLTGKLVNGHDVILLDVELEIWTTDQAVVFPRTALVGLGLPAADQLRFDEIKVQVSALDVVAGIGPLKSFTFPADGSGTSMAHGRSRDNPTAHKSGRTAELPSGWSTTARLAWETRTSTEWPSARWQ